MNSCRELAHDNACCLEQAAALLRTVDDERFSAPAVAGQGDGIGPHLRHVLDHYRCFLRDLPAGRVNYDARDRDPRLESDRNAAIACLDDICRQLRALDGFPGDTPIAIRMDSGNDTDPARWWSRSTPRRELQFLLSHTIHHFALIALLLRLAGLATPAGFGVAPSTLRHQGGLPACAR